MTRKEVKERAEHRKHLIYLYMIYTMGVRCYPPTIREIINAGYAKSKSHVRSILKKMEEDGAIKYCSNGRYTIVGGSWSPPKQYFVLTNEMINIVEKFIEGDAKICITQ